MSSTLPSAYIHSLKFGRETHKGTRDWGFDDVPRTEIGRFYLTENPTKLVQPYQPRKGISCTFYDARTATSPKSNKLPSPLDALFLAGSLLRILSFNPVYSLTEVSTDTVRINTELESFS